MRFPYHSKGEGGWIRLEKGTPPEKPRSVFYRRGLAHFTEGVEVPHTKKLNLFLPIDRGARTCSGFF